MNKCMDAQNLSPWITLALSAPVFLIVVFRFFTS